MVTDTRTTQPGAMRSPKLLSEATKGLRMNKRILDESMNRTIEACAWLIDVAQRSVDHYGWDPVIVRYLERLGSATYAAQTTNNGGMGAVAPMVTQHPH